MIDWQKPLRGALFNSRLPEFSQGEPNVVELELLRALPTLDDHLWLCTSGTTGSPKWIALSRAALTASAQAVNQHLQSGPSDVWLHALPNFHVGGLGIRARAALSGAQVLAYRGPHDQDGWDARHFHRMATETQATLSALVPTQVYDLVSAGLRSPPALRAVIIGGAALTAELYVKGAQLGWILLPSYGMTETSSQIATAALPEGVPSPILPPIRLLPHASVRTDADGRLHIRGQSLLTASAQLQACGERWDCVYYEPRRCNTLQFPQDTDELVTEDRGNLTDGNLAIYGRLGSVLKILGEKVDLARLENVALALSLREGLAGTAVPVALPDARAGHALYLVVDEGDPEAHASWVAGFNLDVAPFERIYRPAVRVARIPRNALGKLLRDELNLLVMRTLSGGQKDV